MLGHGVDEGVAGAGVLEEEAADARGERACERHRLTSTVSGCGRARTGGAVLWFWVRMMVSGAGGLPK